ncbi:component of small subunit processosome [Metschnikowia bicuspidata var. bicuspidata NRRL YB-4993]|uniref:Component of small subunit processosome n=1 Tax=Metschnikowia bicuspidata var. bicuspidata NRRL YB-4993 TaxID=869754 RepID=A0A1A0HAU8_9ASCO|nr:component of small subunit processosome [Metschnikowia bicuspidata var. bicuspidata NRRL YB-4993]OBA21120.1 component of small subunit processosome [Metschnikowia bicuspidata var. bicuspidata NRRL YB-4993]
MAGDPFLSDPARKRKRPARGAPGGKGSRGNARATRDSDISSGSEDMDSDSDSTHKHERDDGDVSSGEEFAEENAADKRRRLAKQYLHNLKQQQIQGDDFDAQDLDDELVARRLQDDVAENRGKMYKMLGATVAQQEASRRVLTARVGLKNVTGVAVHYPHVYTVSKDMELVKWTAGRHGKPRRARHCRGGPRFAAVDAKNPAANHHHGAINCVAASPDGRFVVTGGQDARLVIWALESLACLKVLPTRAPVTALAFRRGSDQLYAACADLRIRTYSVAQHAQLETLYGHQDTIVGISALAREGCVSVGSRDKTAMYWKIAEETRLTFRGGDGDGAGKPAKPGKPAAPLHCEGSIEAVAMVDETHFVTGSDNGSVSFWSLGKKKALHTQRLAHGVVPPPPPARASAEDSAALAARQVPPSQPHWITAVWAVPYSDLFVTGSHSGAVHLWRIDSASFRTFALVGSVPVKGCVVLIDGAELADPKRLVVYIATSKEHRLGRWLGPVPGRNAVVSVEFDL